MGPTSYELANPTTTTSLTKESIKSIFKDMGTRVLSNAKTFGKIGAIYSAFECTVESYRGRHDLYNVGAAGSLTGAALAIKCKKKFDFLLLLCFFYFFSTFSEIFLSSGS